MEEYFDFVKLAKEQKQFNKDKEARFFFEVFLDIPYVG